MSGPYLLPVNASARARASDRRGYPAPLSQTWQDDPPAENTAPGDLGASDPNVSNWGLTQDEAREVLLDRRCPICSAGPFHSPLSHVALKHGIDRFTMRDLCGLSTKERIISPELYEKAAAHGHEVMEAHGDKLLAAAKRGTPNRRFTKAGEAARAAALARGLGSLTPEQRINNARRASRAVSPEGRARQAAVMKDLYARGLHPLDPRRGER